MQHAITVGDYTTRLQFGLVLIQRPVKLYYSQFCSEAACCSFFSAVGSDGSMTRSSLQEIHSKQKSGAAEDSPRRGPDSLPVGHHDIITDIATFQTTQGFIVTSSRDGIVKVWK